MIVVVLAFLLTLWSAPAWAAITCTASNFAYNAATGSTTLTITFTVPSQTNRAVVATIFNSTNETAVISSAVDNNSGTWTTRVGPIDSTNGTGRVWFLEQTTLGGTGSTILTVTFDGSINSQGVAGTCYSDTAALEYVSSATYDQESSSSTWTGPSRTFTNTGVMFADMGASSGACDISSVGTNQTEMTSPTGSRRTQMIVRLESSGAFDSTANLGFNCSGVFGGHLYQEASAAAVQRNLMLLGVGQ
jgi:hypothetical protein